MRWIVVSLVLTCAWVTHHRAAQYQSELLIWQSATQATPSFRAWLNYRNALWQDGQIEQAILACGPLSQLASLRIEHAMLRQVCLSPPR